MFGRAARTGRSDAPWMSTNQNVCNARRVSKTPILAD
jgi:hypothetical protein